ncbi:helix-turn-helix domain-containing protein [Clostridium hydrogenum]|uniref:helix-turn-helix domain-containing protein n=1 Tax=Clostridium hydrogenum TaxID=2855764 RepID=UPI001F18BAEF|nr:helix-turn-helix transcriptional regulator [Clostridium hydrogenum]
MDHILLLDDYSDPNLHRHFAKHLIISLKDEISCRVEEKIISCNGILIDSNVMHTIDSKNQQVVVFLFDETSDIAEEFQKQYFTEKHFAALPKENVKEIVKIWGKFIEAKKENIAREYKKTFKKIMELCDIKVKIVLKKDDRIESVVEYLNCIDSISEGTLDELAKHVFLSKSRLSHLFKEQVGISLNQFLVIEKMRKTYEYLNKGYNITDAAIKAGFNSSSHFANTNKTMFGVTAKELKNTMNYIIIE